MSINTKKTTTTNDRRAIDKQNIRKWIFANEILPRRVHQTSYFYCAIKQRGRGGGRRKGGAEERKGGRDKHGVGARVEEYRGRRE